jgi:hypothetical protein
MERIKKISDNYHTFFGKQNGLMPLQYLEYIHEMIQNEPHTGTCVYYVLLEMIYRGLRIREVKCCLRGMNPFLLQKRLELRAIKWQVITPGCDGEAIHPPPPR